MSVGYGSSLWVDVVVCDYGCSLQDERGVSVVGGLWMWFVGVVCRYRSEWGLGVVCRWALR